MRTSLLSVALAASLASTAVAGPLKKSYVPDGVQWVAHVDVEAVLSSSLGRFALAAQGEHMEDFAQLKAELGIDPLKDIKSITVFGAGCDPEDGIAVIETTAAVDQMIDRIKEKEKNFKTITEGRLTIYSWSEHETERFGLVRRGKNSDDRLVLVAPDKVRLLDSLKVLEGKAASMAGAKEGLLAKSPKPGSFIFAAAVDLQNAEAVPFKKAEAFLADVGETDGTLFADLIVVPKNTEDAKNLTNIIRGAVSMAVMFAQNDPGAAELARLTERLEYGTDEGRITIHFSYPTEGLIRVLSDAKAKHEESENPPAKVKPARKNHRDDGDHDR